MQKRGLGHIEMILAFLLFIGFLFFGIYFFNPLNANRLLDSSVDYAVREIIQNTSINTLSYSIVINASDPAVVAIPISAFQAIPENSFLVLDSRGNVLKSEKQTASLLFDRGSERFVRIISGNFDVVNDIPSAGITLPAGNYTISSSESKELASEKKIGLLKTRYDSDYLGLKKDFNLPGRVDFSFATVFSEINNVTATQEVPQGIEALARQERIEVLMADGKVQFADLFVRVW